jgi:hypothetical protein
MLELVEDSSNGISTHIWLLLQSSETLSVERQNVFL